MTMIELFNIANEATKNAYIPYSNFPVGAAILTEDGKIFTGVNVENRSLGATNCAERTAIFQLINEGYKTFKAIAIATPRSDTPVSPCGICRQVLTEFAPLDTPVCFGSKIENLVYTTLGELYTFDCLHDLSKY